MMVFAENEWRRAKRTAVTARLLIATDPESAASRAYYAAFHGLTAVFALRDQSFAKHAALRSAVHHDLVHPGAVPAEVGSSFDYLADLRRNADYTGVGFVTPAKAMEAVEAAEKILDVVRGLCPELEKGSQGA